MRWGTDLAVAPVHGPTAHHLAVAVGGTVLVADGCTTARSGGRAVAVLHHLAAWHDPEANLLLLGPVGGAAGHAALDELVRELGLPRCWVLGDAGDDVRAACWHRADVALAVGDDPAAGLAATAAAFAVPLVGGEPTHAAEEVAVRLARPGPAGRR